MEAHASPRVTMREKLSILKERVVHGRSSNESEEFLEAFEKLLRLRSQLRTVERGVKKWLNSSKALAKSALFLAQAVDTDKETYFQLSTDMEAELQDTSTLKAIAKKLGMLDTLVKDRRALVDLRHLKNRAARKAKLVMSRDSDDESKRRALAHEETNKARYDENYAQLLAAMRFVVGEADERGHCALIAPELSAFKLFQFSFFLNAQKIIQGSSKEEASGDLDAEWNKFTVELSAERERAQSSVPPAQQQQQQQQQRGAAGALTGLAAVPEQDKDAFEDSSDEDEDSDVLEARRSAARGNGAAADEREDEDDEDDEERMVPEPVAVQASARDQDDDGEDDEEGDRMPPAQAAGRGGADDDDEDDEHVARASKASSKSRRSSGRSSGSRRS